MYETLTESNFLLFCAKHYDSRFCSSTEEFLEDLSRIKYLKKLITRYKNDGDLKDRLILNHIIVLNNVFGPINACRILYLKLKTEFQYIKPFLVFLNMLPEHLYYIGDEDIIDMNNISMDVKIIEALRKI